jgi:hypothetical protein
LQKLAIDEDARYLFDNDTKIMLLWADIDGLLRKTVTPGRFPDARSSTSSPHRHPFDEVARWQNPEAGWHPRKRPKQYIEFVFRSD